MRREISVALVILAVTAAAAVLGGCKEPPTRAEKEAVDYGPRPENAVQIVREYLGSRLNDPAAAIIEFKAGPTMLYQQDTALRPLRYGWAVCVFVNDKNSRGAYDGFYPLVFFIRHGKIVAANGGEQDNIVGWRYARAGCNELGAPFVTR